MTCWRRLKAWQELEIWEQFHRLLLAALRKAGKLDLSLAIVDSTTSRAVGGGDDTGPNPTDRRKPGTKQVHPANARRGLERSGHAFHS